MFEALIGDRKMYMEAIEVLWKNSPIPMSFLITVDAIDTGTIELLGRITKLVVEYEFSLYS